MGLKAITKVTTKDVLKQMTCVVINSGNTMQKKEITVQYYPNKMVRDLRKVIAKVLKVEMSLISLTYNDRIMSDLKPVSDYKIAKDKKVHVQMGVKGKQILLK